MGCCGAKVTVETLDRARAYAAAVPGAVSGGGGHNQTFALANALTWGFGLDDDAALQVLLEWNTGCQPPWLERELRHKVQQSRKANHPKPYGHLLGTPERRTHAHTWQAAPPAETATWKIKRRSAGIAKPAVAEPSQPSQVEAAPQRDAENLADAPSQPSQTVSGNRPPLDWAALDAEHPPSEDEKNWQAVVEAGFGDEPLILAAFTTFGPGCTVIETGRATP